VPHHQCFTEPVLCLLLQSGAAPRTTLSLATELPAQRRTMSEGTTPLTGLGGTPEEVCR
jgi:hypothetical protein